MFAPLEDAFYNHVWDAAPFAPSLRPRGATGTVPLNFDSPWSTFASTGGKSPFPPFASPSQIPASSVSFITPVSLPAVFASNYRLGITQSWNLSLEQSFGKQFVLHLAYVGAPVVSPGNDGRSGSRTLFHQFCPQRSTPH